METSDHLTCVIDTVCVCIFAARYASGLADAGGAHELSDADGRTWWVADDGAPGRYIPGTNYLEQLLGTFADASGSIVGSPFTIGNGPLSVVIPTGATQLLMGFNDGWYNDNGAGNLTMKITEVPAIPEPEIYALMLAGLGLLGFAAQRRKHRVTTVGKYRKQSTALVSALNFSVTDLR